MSKAKLERINNFYRDAYLVKVHYLMTPQQRNDLVEAGSELAKEGLPGLVSAVEEYLNRKRMDRKIEQILTELGIDVAEVIFNE
jgi:hypothetical protein